MTNDNRQERLELTITDCPWCHQSHSHILHVRRSVTHAAISLGPLDDTAGNIIAAVIGALVALTAVALTAVWRRTSRQRAQQEKVTHDVILMCPITNREFIATIEGAGDDEFEEQR